MGTAVPIWLAAKVAALRDEKADAKREGFIPPTGGMN
jgi:hypothetical protein